MNDKPIRHEHHVVWDTKQGRRVRSIGSALRWPLIGALVAGGALVVFNIFGDRVARQLGAAGGESFAEGLKKAQDQFAALGRGERWS